MVREPHALWVGQIRRTHGNEAGDDDVFRAIGADDAKFEAATKVATAAAAQQA